MMLGPSRVQRPGVAAARWIGMVKSAPFDVTFTKPGEGGDDEAPGAEAPAVPADHRL
jgi:hypothetical protein